MTARWRMPPEKWCGQSFMRSSARSMPTRRISSSTRSRTAARESPGAWTRTASAIWPPIVIVGLSEVMGS